MMIDVRKAAIIGCGFVGASIAFSLMQRGLYSELVLIDSDREKAAGEAMDLSHGLPYAASMQIYAGTYDDTADCSMVILAAGASQKPGETRLDLIGRNTAILRRILPELTGRGFQGILLVVSNPVDVLTYAAWRLSELPAGQVFGSGTVLDTARLKYLLGQELGVDSRNVHAAILGEHGDSELAVWSSANISSIDLDRFCQLRGRPDRAGLDRIYREVRGTAPMRSSAVRGPPTTGSPWLWPESPSASSGMSGPCSPSLSCSRASTGWTVSVSASPPSWAGTVWSRCWRSLWTPESARRCWTPQPV